MHRRTLRGHEGAVTCVGLLPALAYSGSEDGSIMLWDVASGNPILSLQAGHPVMAMQVGVEGLEWEAVTSNWVQPPQHTACAATRAGGDIAASHWPMPAGLVRGKGQCRPRM